MKIFKRYLAFAVVLVLLFTGCSKEEVGSPIDEPSSETAVLSFGAVLDDLANRAANKGHFGQVPDCEDEADPQVARVTISYGDVTATIDVDILFDGENYYTDYSSELEIPVSVDGDDDNTDDFTTVSLDGFIVYDGDPDDGGNAIWVAPVASVEFPDADFSGYVDNPLPFDIIVRPGVKKYVDVEVLCFDRRMVNQYGYLFFDIIPGELVPLCFFANYCDEDGRHYPGFYGIDLFVEDAQGVRTQIYSSDTSRPEIGDYNANNQDAAEYYAEPLCLVVPGPPNGVDDDEDYLFYVVTPLDWDAAYGEDADNTSLTEEGLSWNEVQELLNNDGATNEYVHLFINCDDDGNGGNECDPTNPNGDCDNDDILNKCDLDNPNYSTFDCDGDTVPNGQDNCPNRANTGQEPDQDCDGILDINEEEGCINNPNLNCGVDPTDPCENLPAVCSIPQINDDLEQGCNFVYFDFDAPDSFMVINSAQTEIILENSIGDTFGKVNTSQTNGVVSLSIDGNLIDDLIIAYEVEIRLSNENGSISATCWESSCDSDVIAFDVEDRDQTVINLSFSDFDYTYPYYVRVKAISCGSGGPQ